MAKAVNSCFKYEIWRNPSWFFNWSTLSTRKSPPHPLLYNSLNLYPHYLPLPHPSPFKSWLPAGCDSSSSFLRVSFFRNSNLLKKLSRHFKTFQFTLFYWLSTIERHRAFMLRRSFSLILNSKLSSLSFKLLHSLIQPKISKFSPSNSLPFSQLSRSRKFTLNSSKTHDTKSCNCFQFTSSLSVSPANISQGFSSITCGIFVNVIRLFTFPNHLIELLFYCAVKLESRMWENAENKQRRALSSWRESV